MRTRRGSRFCATSPHEIVAQDPAWWQCDKRENEARLPPHSRPATSAERVGKRLSSYERLHADVLLGKRTIVGASIGGRVISQTRNNRPAKSAGSTLLPMYQEKYGPDKLSVSRGARRERIRATVTLDCRISFKATSRFDRYDMRKSNVTVEFERTIPFSPSKQASFRRKSAIQPTIQNSRRVVSARRIVARVRAEDIFPFSITFPLLYFLLRLQAHNNSWRDFDTNLFTYIRIYSLYTLAYVLISKLEHC